MVNGSGRFELEEALAMVRSRGEGKGICWGVRKEMAIRQVGGDGERWEMRRGMKRPPSKP